MILTLNGITVEIQGEADVQVSEDGKKVTVKPQAGSVEERIRVVEIPGPPQEVIRVVEVEVEKPCTRPHYPQVKPSWPEPYRITSTGGPDWTYHPTVTCEGTSVDLGTSSNTYIYNGGMNGGSISKTF